MAQLLARAHTYGSWPKALQRVENLPQQDSASNKLNKLARTFTAQVETLKNYRSSGEQHIRVQHQHVTVNDGRQAIVAGHIHVEALGVPLPSAGLAQQDCVPLPRRLAVRRRPASFSPV